MNTNPFAKKKIVIVGQGAIGLLCYHHLQQAQNQVSLLDSKSSSRLRSQLSSEVSSKVSYKKSTKEKSKINSNQLLSSPRLPSDQYLYTAYQATEASYYPLIYAQHEDIKQADIIMLCVKSYQIATAIKSVANLIKAECLVILAHNGMGTLTETKQILPCKQRVLAMLTTHGCFRGSSITITHTGIGHSDIGLLAGEMTKTEESELALLFNQAMATFTFEPEIVKKQWLKLAINCVINPITAINNIENGQVNLVEFTEIKASLIIEIVNIAKAEGIDFSEGQLTSTIRLVSQATAKNSSSMRCDILAKRRTEIDYINGYIHRLGIKHCIATPINSQIWQAVKKMENGTEYQSD